MTTRMPPLGEGSPVMRRAVWVGGLVAFVAVVAGAFFLGSSLRGGGGGGDGSGDNGNATPAKGSPTAQESVSVEQALEQYVTQQLGEQYVGDCSASLVPKEEGKLCSAPRGDRTNKKAFLLGPSSYEFTLWVFLSKQGDTWKVDSTQPATPDAISAAGAPWPLEKGAKVVVVAGAGPPCINVRPSPGIKEAAVDCIADGTVLVLADGPVEADGHQWWQPQDRGGWVAGDWLRYADDVATPTPIAASAGPTPTP
jgi:hypothetical protein